MIYRGHNLNMLLQCIAGSALVIAGLLVIPVCATAAQDTGKTASEDGRRLYIQYGCYQCHGYEGQGGLTSGPRIAPDPVPLPAFIEISRRPYGIMPAFSQNVLSDEELQVIYEYLLSIGD